MPRLLLALLALFVAGALAADAPAEAPAKKAPRAGRNPNLLPESIPGVEPAEYAKIRMALLATAADESVADARKRLADLKERTRFVSGRSEAEDLQADFEKARDAMVQATIAAVAKHDPSISKDSLVLTLNAIEEATRKRGQEAAAKARAQAETEAKARKKDEPAVAEAAPAKAADAKPLTPATLLADVEGVSKEDMNKFRVAAGVAQRDPKLKELKARQAELRKEAEFASDDQKRSIRGEFEALMGEMHKATLEAVCKAAPSLSKETAEKILEAVEARMKAAATKGATKASGKTPLKPFPFGDKK